MVHISLWTETNKAINIRTWLYWYGKQQHKAEIGGKSFALKIILEKHVLLNEDKKLTANNKIETVDKSPCLEVPHSSYDAIMLTTVRVVPLHTYPVPWVTGDVAHVSNSGTVTANTHPVAHFDHESENQELT